MAEPGWLPPPGLRRAARLAVACARPVALLPPAGIRWVLATLSRGCRAPDPADVLQWRNAVNSVSARCAGNGCLERSISVMLLAAARRQAPVWCAGFRPDPFLAHAWVEAGGAPVGEPDLVRTYFRTVVVVPRWADETVTNETTEEAR